ncbi:putative leucine-rich repeat domain superfamily [Helianthus anomalus]
MTPNLEKLSLRECYDFVELHSPIKRAKLKSLVLSGSKVSNLNLGMTPHLEMLDLERCYNLQEIDAPMGYLKKFVYLNLSGCSRFKDFLVDKRYESAGLASAAELELAAESLDICQLHPNSNLSRFQFKCNYDEPQGWSGNLEKLISFGLCACTHLESFSATICGLQRLRNLTLEGGIPEVPKDLWQLESLVKLTLWMKKITHLPDNICMLKHLESLDLKSCCLLEQLPKDLDRLESLKELDLTDCISLRDIPKNICKMKCLTNLLLSRCTLVDKLPEELGNLECLKELKMEGIGITQLPDSICMLKHMESLNLKSCWRLEQLPKDLDRLESLKELDLTDCISLRDIPNNICKVKCLTNLVLSHCTLLEKLPEELGNIECLEQLNIEGTGITHLPHSIFGLKGLCIVWSRGQLLSYGFTSLKAISRYTASCYVLRR